MLLSDFMKNIVFQIIVLTVLTGCSIKEDRTQCPCTVMVDFSGIDSVRHGITDILALTDGAVVLDDRVPSARYDELYTFRARRVSTTVDIYSGWTGDSVAGKGFTVNEGEQFPELYLQTEQLDTDKESVSLTAMLHKSFCRVTIDIKSEGDYPYSLSVTGNACGYTCSGETVPGAFEYSPIPDQAGLCSVRIPRQYDSSLILRIAEDNDILREFALGEYIVKSGYDWKAEDLEDVSVEIDYAKADVVFKVNDWETTVSFDVII